MTKKENRKQELKKQIRGLETLIDEMEFYDDPAVADCREQLHGLMAEYARLAGVALPAGFPATCETWEADDLFCFVDNANAENYQALKASNSFYTGVWRDALKEVIA